MNEGMFSAVVLGTVVDGSVADQFKKAIEPYSAEEVIKSFIYSVINGDLNIAWKGSEENAVD